MSDDYDPNAGLFGGDEPELSPEELHVKRLFGKNPGRTDAMADLFGKEMMQAINADSTIPEEGKRQMIFKMAANSVLDIVMECLSPETAEEVAECFDHYIGMCIVNKKYSIDLMKELYDALEKVEMEEGESEEQFESRIDAMAESWWSIPQPLLNKRNPTDAIQEEILRYGLED